MNKGDQKLLDGLIAEYRTIDGQLELLKSERRRITYDKQMTEGEKELLIRLNLLAKEPLKLQKLTVQSRILELKRVNGLKSFAVSYPQIVPSSRR